jgi:hypothetical protein
MDFRTTDLRFYWNLNGSDLHNPVKYLIPLQKGNGPPIAYSFNASDV